MSERPPGFLPLGPLPNESAPSARPAGATAVPTGTPHDDTLGKDKCGCTLCAFNKQGSAIRVCVADAKECSEGVSFLGVRHLLLVDVPAEPADFLQRVGRAVRFMGHAGLASKKPLEESVACMRRKIPLPTLNGLLKMGSLASRCFDAASTCTKTCE